MTTSLHRLEQASARSRCLCTPGFSFKRGALAADKGRNNSVINGTGRVKFR